MICLALQVLVIRTHSLRMLHRKALQFTLDPWKLCYSSQLYLTANDLRLPS